MVNGRRAKDSGVLITAVSFGLGEPTGITLVFELMSPVLLARAVGNVNSREP